MKKLLGVGVAFLVALILIGLLVAKLFFPNSPASVQQPTQDPFAHATNAANQIQTDSPANTAQSCIAWYVQAAGYGANGLTAQARQEAATCFTASFIAQWSDIIVSSGSDPVLLSQFIDPTWNVISVSSQGQSVSSNDELVTLGTGAHQQRIVAHVVRDRSDGTWRIDSVTAATTGDTP